MDRSVHVSVFRVNANVPIIFGKAVSHADIEHVFPWSDIKTVRRIISADGLFGTIVFNHCDDWSLVDCDV